MEKLLEIIVPVYGLNNQESIINLIGKYQLDGYLESLPIRFILVHDNSSSEVLPEMLDLVNINSNDSVLVTTFGSNKGTHYARYAGVMLSTAPYVTFLDADDFYDINELSKVIDILKSNAFDFVDTIGTYNAEDNLWHDDIRRISSSKLMVNDIILGGPTSICYGFYKSELIKSAFETITEGNDTRYSVYSEDLIEMLAILNDKHYLSYLNTSFKPYKYQFSNGGGISNEVMSIGKLTRIIRSTKTNLEMLEKISMPDDLKYVVSNTMSHNANNFVRQYLGLSKVPWGI